MGHPTGDFMKDAQYLVEKRSNGPLLRLSPSLPPPLLSFSRYKIRIRTHTRLWIQTTTTEWFLIFFCWCRSWSLFKARNDPSSAWMGIAASRSCAPPWTRGHGKWSRWASFITNNTICHICLLNTNNILIYPYQKMYICIYSNIYVINSKCNTFLNRLVGYAFLSVHSLGYRWAYEYANKIFRSPWQAQFEHRSPSWANGVCPSGIWTANWYRLSSGLLGGNGMGVEPGAPRVAFTC